MLLHLLPSINLTINCSTLGLSKEFSRATHSHIARWLADVLAQPLAKLFEKKFTTALMPTNCRLATIYPIFRGRFQLPPVSLTYIVHSLKRILK